MEYDKKFILDFIKRTYQIVNDYNGDYEATLLINCLLGLIVMPKEQFKFNGNLQEWGVDQECIKEYKCELGCKHSIDEISFHQFLRHMRNAIAHSDFEPFHERSTVKGFTFKQKGFKATMNLEQIRQLIEQLHRWALRAY